jgi:uncharacterized protein (TIGR02646 family)
MRHAVRSAVPELLAQHGAVWCQEFMARRAADPAYRFQWKQHRGQRVNILLREPLSTMTQAHCAYCDGFPLDDTSYETIDHFLPKALYPEFAYEWKNLYLVCVKCQEKKESNFDIRVDRATYQDELLRPDESGYRFERYFLFNYENGHIECNPHASAIDQARAHYTIDALGLNKDGRPKSRKRILRLFAAHPSEERNLGDWPYRFLLEH